MLWVMVLVEAPGAMQNGRQDGHNFGFHLMFKLFGKTQKLQRYFARVVKYDTKHFPFLVVW